MKAKKKIKSKSKIDYSTGPAFEAKSKSRQAADKMYDAKGGNKSGLKSKLTKDSEGNYIRRSVDSSPASMAKGGLTGGQKKLDKNKDGKISGADFKMMKKGGKVRMYKKGGGMSGLDAAQKQVYKRGLAAYMSSGNRPKTSQHAWAMARVKSDFGKKEAAKIRSGKGKAKK